MPTEIDLVLIFISYKTSYQEVLSLRERLLSLPSNIQFSVFVNSYLPSDPITILKSYTPYFFSSSRNLGYGIAANNAVKLLPVVPKYLGILNTDISWDDTSFPNIINFMESSADTSLCVPQIYDLNGKLQYLSKQNPSILSLLSRRFIPTCLKPSWLLKYDYFNEMRHMDYSISFEAPYLSGCCMIFRSSSYLEIGGFDERFFLYLEDADITRSISRIGKSLHFANSRITHSWGRGNHKSIWLTLVNILSAILYFAKWGLKLR